MPVGARGVHLSKRIDLMAEETAIGFVIPALDLPNTGTNAAGRESDDVSIAAVMGDIVLQELQKVRVMASVLESSN
jgi:hypothetical protein